MKNQMKSLVSFLLIMQLFFGSVAFAQEETEEAPAPSQEVVIVPTVEAPVDVVSPAPSETVSVNLVQVIIGLLGAFAAGGIVGIAGLSVFVQRLQKDTATVTALELLANSWPPETRELLLGLSRGAKQLGALGEEVFDDKPVSEKQILQE